MIEQTIARLHAYKEKEDRVNKSTYACMQARTNSGEWEKGTTEQWNVSISSHLSTTQRNEIAKERMCDWMNEHKIQGAEEIDRKQ